MTILVTGGCGFIGSAYLSRFVPNRQSVRFVNLDSLTYAANPLSLSPIQDLPNYLFVKADIRDVSAVQQAFESHRPDVVVHFAAESHVDRSIHGPRDFVETNVVGTLNLLEACRASWQDFEGKRFHHVSTDEVYGSLGPTGAFTETTAYDPSSPYSASKAGSDHLVRAYHRTYGLPITITNCSNNYGPRQFPEKLIPLMVLNALERKPLPIYGKGANVRDWLYVDDHCDAIEAVLDRGRIGETYNVGGNSERANIDVVRSICQIVAEETIVPIAEIEDLITYVQDRPGHDFRYAIDASKIREELGWQPAHNFDEGLRETIRWYLDHTAWTDSVRTGAYRAWINRNYQSRV